MDTSKASFGSGVRQAISSTLVLLLLCGFAFPLLMTGLGSVIFPHQAGGNLIYVDGQAVGAQFVGQEFTDPRFLKGRPSQYHYNTYYEENGVKYYLDGSEYAGLGSGSANYGNSNPALVERVQADMEAFLESHIGVSREQIPGDLLTASGSGLDPHISPAAAQIQIPTLAKETGLSEERLQEIVQANTTPKAFGIFGEDVVNVLGVNLDIAQELGMISNPEQK